MLIGIYFKTIKKDQVILETRNKLKIKIRTHSTDIMQLGTVWFTNDYNMPGFEIRDNDIIVDVGAHIGLFALFASQFCKNGKIYCFEPIKENYEMLSDNTNLNEIKNIIPLNLAVSKENEHVRIYLDLDESAHSIFPQGNTFVDVKSTTVKRFFDEYKIENCDLVKIDCEGAEYEIIDSIPEEYFSRINKIIIEYHLIDKKLELYQNLLKKLENMSFKTKTRKISEDMGMIYAMR
ncbi:methyltransferase, FkbM family [Candidatus Nitrosarchaeum limnium BG20]|uniref:Methyltransferase, FkbM family n=2 Tax=Nitrosarchaeum TaxID=1007082 RepID=S2E6Z2_9ARCH|nr:methyltransferase, FkbM family [Candidatus Nitrosarchaeum limnium BG20]